MRIIDNISKNAAASDIHKQISDENDLYLLYNCRYIISKLQSDAVFDVLNGGLLCQ